MDKNFTDTESKAANMFKQTTNEDEETDEEL